MKVPPLVHRVKLLVATHGTAIAAVLVLVGLVAFAGAAWAVAHPPTVEVTEQADTHTIGTDVETSTVVTGNTSLWERGTTLENKPLYPIGSAPRLTVDIQTSVPPDQEVQVKQELSIVYQASRDGNVFWNTDQLLVAEDRTVTDGTVSSTTTFDVREVRDQIEEINGELTGIGQAQAYLRLNVTYQTESYAGTLSKTASLSVTSAGYWIGGSLEGENTHQTPVTREVTQSGVPMDAIWLGLLGLVSMGGAGGIVYVSSRRLDAGEIADELDSQRYREWVSTGQIGQVMASQDVMMDSLKDLVDVAIDSNHRVVYDEGRNLYAVVDDNVIYYYDPYFDEPDPEPEIEFEPSPDPGLGATVQGDGGFSSPFDRAQGRRTAAGPSAAAPGSETQPEDTNDTACKEGKQLSPEVVSLARSVDPEGDRLVLRYELTADVSEPVAVEVVDGVIAECDRLESVSPRRGVEPTDHHDRDGEIAFRTTVPAEEPGVVEFVVQPAESAWWGTFETVRSASPPRVTRVSHEAD